MSLWVLKSLKRHMIWQKMQKLKFHYFTIVHFVNSLVKIKCQIYVPKSSWNDPKSILSIKVCTITTFFQVLHRKIKFFEKLTHPSVPIYCPSPFSSNSIVLGCQSWGPGFDSPWFHFHFQNFSSILMCQWSLPW